MVICIIYVSIDHRPEHDVAYLTTHMYTNVIKGRTPIDHSYTTMNHIHIHIDNSYTGNHTQKSFLTRLLRARPQIYTDGQISMTQCSMTHCVMPYIAIHYDIVPYSAIYGRCHTIHYHTLPYVKVAYPTYANIAWGKQ